MVLSTRYERALCHRAVADGMRSTGHLLMIQLSRLMKAIATDFGVAVLVRGIHARRCCRRLLLDSHERTTLFETR